MARGRNVRADIEAESQRIDAFWQGLTPEAPAAAEQSVAAADASPAPRIGTGRTGRPLKPSVTRRRDLATKFLTLWNNRDNKDDGFNTKWAIDFVRNQYGIHRSEALAILQKIRAARA
jgi:hypothetical protein